MTTTSEVTREIAADLKRFQHDPLSFVRWAFPWGEGTLADKAGPDEWQADILNEIGQGIASDRQKIQEAVASGKGIGKSCLVAWIALWSILTKPHTRGVITAGSEPQLRTKTMPELGKWHGLMFCKKMLTFTQTALVVPGYEKTWRIDAIPWSAHNPEAFAGLHNQGARILVIFDEASQIDDVIWDTTDGIMSDRDTEVAWVAFGNPTRVTGRFRECFGRYASRWKHRQIDSRSVAITDKAELAALVEERGEDSDYIRVNVRGHFPRQSSNTFISTADVDNAVRVQPHVEADDPIVMGVDVARFGDDETVITTRMGRDARTIPTIRIQGLPTTQVAGRITSEIARLDQIGIRVDMVFIDETGVGAGVLDRTRDLGVACMGVNNGAKPDRTSVEGELVANKGAECWASMRAALRSGLAIPDDDDLRNQLESREFGYDKHNRILLERKDDLKARGLSSPDLADALALTYAYPVRKDGTRAMRQTKAISEFNPYEDR